MALQGSKKECSCRWLSASKTLVAQPVDHLRRLVATGGACVCFKEAVCAGDFQALDLM